MRDDDIGQEKVVDKSYPFNFHIYSIRFRDN